METINLNYGEDQVQNYVALIILILIVITLTSIWLIQQKPIFIGIIGVIFAILMYLILTKALNVPCEVKFSNSLQIKIYNTTWFYNQESIHFEKNELIEFQEIKAKGYYYYVLKTHKGTIRLHEPNQRISNIKLIQGFEILGVKRIS